MTRTTLIIFCVFFLTSCGEKLNTDFRKVEFSELLQRIKNGDVDQLSLPITDSSGKALSKELKSKLNQGLLFRDFYANSENEITLVKLKEYSHETVFEEIQIREALSKPFDGFVFLEIDCAKTDSLLRDAFEKDQAVRTGGEGDIMKTDALNRQLVISILEHCGWPKEEEMIRSIWFIIQHSPSGFMAHYYPKFKEMVNKGLLSPGMMALMDDRLLMNNGYPQIYGSQITSGSVYTLRDPLNINTLRASVGLGPIEEYTQHFGFEFKLDDYIKK